jgi:hypothetical protein
MSKSFRLNESEVHPLIKLIGVAFHSLNNETNPKGIRFTTNELERMFELHDSLGRFLDYLESQASDINLKEVLTYDSSVHNVPDTYS